MKRLLLVFLLVLVAACAPKVPVAPVPETAQVAVAPPVLPSADWELLAGALPQQPPSLSEEESAGLRQILAQETARLTRPVLGMDVVAGCAERTVARVDRRRMSAVAYWQEVGRCAGADFILVPFVLFWEDRIGGSWGVERPAHIILDLYLVDIASGGVQRFHYEEEQRGLVENLFWVGKFAQRRGRWLTAHELAQEAIAQGLRSLGLRS